MKVIIIGAGLGGLCLAHGLRNSGIEVVVFERSTSAGVEPATYGIHLDADGIAAVEACLALADFRSLEARAKYPPDVVRFWNSQLAPFGVIERNRRRWAISRKDLRAGLLGDFVRWNKTFVRYDESASGVVAHFADGTSETGTILVGADGCNSKVRKQRLPGLDRVDLGILNVAGRAAIPSDLPSLLVDGSVNNVVPSGPGWVFLSTWDAMLVWAWVGPTSSYPDGDLQAHILGCTTGWSAALREVIRTTDPATIALVPLRTMPSLAPWTPSNVTLLGDAIHNMTPMAGIGANTALRDADELRRALVDGTIADYEVAMRKYANRALAESTRNAQNAASTSRIKRALFRTGLRLIARA